MVFTKKSSYIKQIIIYMSQKKFNDAFALSKEFTDVFPEDLVSHYFLAKSAFYIGVYEKAREAALKAFNLSKDTDIITTGLLLGSIMYMQNEFSDGYHLLETIEKKIGNTKELQELMAAFALVLNNPERAAAHIGKLLDLNKSYGDGFILALLTG